MPACIVLPVWTLVVPALGRRGIREKARPTGFGEDAILEGHFQATTRRFAAATGVVLVVQDTTEFSFRWAKSETICAIARVPEKHGAAPLRPDTKAGSTSDATGLRQRTALELLAQLRDLGAPVGWPQPDAATASHLNPSGKLRRRPTGAGPAGPPALLSRGGTRVQRRHAGAASAHR